MRARTVSLIVVVLVGCAFAVYYRLRPDEARAPTGTGLSAEEKDRIRKFWEIYREARTLQLGGRWQDAIARYERALELDPRHEDTLYNLANCHFELDHFDDALNSLRRLVEVNPQSHRAHLQIGAVRACPLAGALFDLDAADAALNRAFEINREETGSLLALGEVALVLGDVDRAFDLFTLANQSNFRAVEGYYLRAYIRWKEKRLDESRELLSEALEQSRQPTVVAAIPGEGDTRGDTSLPPTTRHEKRLLQSSWSGLADRHTGREIDAAHLEAEFGPLDARLKELTALAEK